MNEPQKLQAEQFEIRRAERRQARLRFAICAASNGGKTWTALELAFGLVEELLSQGVLNGRVEGKIGLVDSERRSAQLYAHLGPFDTIELGPPFSPERYVKAMHALERAGVSVIILDSISHAWMGDGGLYRILDRFEADERWRAFGTNVTPQQDAFIDAMLASPCHIIATMRSRTKWVLEQKENKRGQLVHAPKRIGMQPIQRPGIEYEFTTMVDLETDSHAAMVVKNRCPVFANWSPRPLSREHGRALAAWLLEGAPEPSMPVSGTPLERAQAVGAAGVRACERAPNLPDLQRVFEDALRSLRAFGGVVEEPELLQLRDELIAAKDERKLALGAAPSVPVVSAEQAIALGDWVRACGLAEAEILGRLKVSRFGLVPSSRLAEVMASIATAARARGLGREKPMPAPGSVLGGLISERPAARDSFADMESDLPWKD